MSEKAPSDQEVQETIDAAAAMNAAMQEFFANGGTPAQFFAAYQSEVAAVQAESSGGQQSSG